MAGSLNKWELMIADYISGQSLPQVAESYGISQSTARYHIKKSGELRSRTDGVRNAARNGRLGSGNRGRNLIFSEEHCAAISKGRKDWAKDNAAGVSLKPNGYLEHTVGRHKGRSVHCVIMEKRLGRPLMEDEVVHHIDGNKQNNSENNLALITRSGHTRLHRREDALQNKTRERKENGRFS